VPSTPRRVTAMTASSGSAICAASLEQVERLIEQSLLRRWASGRLGMLETIREFGLERLAESGEQDAIARAHADYFLVLVEVAEKKGVVSYTPEWLERLEAERDNCRAAMRWAFDAADPLLALRIAVALGQFWVVRSAHQEARGWLTEAIDAAPDAPRDLRARALRELAPTYFLAGEYEPAAMFTEQALDLFSELGDKREVALTLDMLSAAVGMLGDVVRARALADESLALCRELDDRELSLYPLSKVALHEWLRGDQQLARCPESKPPRVGSSSRRSSGRSGRKGDRQRRTAVRLRRRPSGQAIHTARPDQRPLALGTRRDRDWSRDRSEGALLRRRHDRRQGHRSGPSLHDHGTGRDRRRVLGQRNPRRPSGLETSTKDDLTRQVTSDYVVVPDTNSSATFFDAATGPARAGDPGVEAEAAGVDLQQPLDRVGEVAGENRSVKCSTRHRSDSRMATDTAIGWVRRIGWPVANVRRPYGSAIAGAGGESNLAARREPSKRAFYGRIVPDTAGASECPGA
jgi:tetratricopeptide (TPR) repeat protein